VAALEVRVLRSIAEIEGVRSTWLSWQGVPNSDLDFYLTVITARPEFVRPHVIVLYRDNSPVAMLIGRVERRGLDLRLGYVKLFSPKVTMLAFGYGGFLGSAASDGSDLMIRAVAKCLRDGEANVAFFNHLRADSALYYRIVTHPGLLTHDFFPSLQPHWRLLLPNSTDGLHSGMGRNTRKNHRSQANRLLKAFSGKVRIQCFRAISELDRMIEDIEKIAVGTYQRSLGVGFVNSSEMRRHVYFEAEHGRFRGYILYVDEEPCAFWTGIVYAGTFHGELTGYDPKYADYSPGTFLTMRTLEDFCGKDRDDQITACDFGLGDATYKRSLANQEWLDAAVYLFAPNLRGVSINLVRTPFMAIGAASRRLLGETKLLSRTKTAWRNMVRMKQPT